ncbi:MAG: hypothetical protein ACMG55_09195 [Microcoleus sp.]
MRFYSTDKSRWVIQLKSQRRSIFATHVFKLYVPMKVKSQIRFPSLRAPRVLSGDRPPDTL